jgi:osmotically-inducible protein OsmY
MGALSSMTDHHSISTRSDIDIRKDVIGLIATYPPLAYDRHYIDVQVENGLVTLTGNLRTPINRTYLNAEAVKVEGVTGVNTDALFDDETIRLHTGRVLPPGVMVNVTNGVVVLSGELDGVDVDAMGATVAAVPGVVRVLVRD